MIIDLTKGLSDNDQYKAFKFPGGELHFILKNAVYHKEMQFEIGTRINSSDDLMLLIIAVETIKKDFPKSDVNVFIPYMPYQQADRNFAKGESFTLNTVTKLLNMLDVDSYTVYDPHSYITPTLLKNITVIDNSSYVRKVVNSIGNEKDLILLSPDAGAYKKVFELASNLKFEGTIVCANKYRSTKDGKIESIEIPRNDFNGQNILIVDDICVGGRTFIELAKVLKERNCGKIYLAVSHGIFSNGFQELFTYFEQVFTTNSREDEIGYINLIAQHTPKDAESRASFNGKKLTVIPIF